MLLFATYRYQKGGSSTFDYNNKIYQYSHVKTNYFASIIKSIQ